MPVQLSDFQSRTISSFVGVVEEKDHFLLIEIGLGLSIFGVGFIFIGMIFLFDKGLLALGNVSDCNRFDYISCWNLDSISCWIKYDHWFRTYLSILLSTS